MSVRLFVALDLPDDVRAAVPAPPRPFRPVPVEFLHVTLAFLGWRDEADVDAAAAALVPPPVGELALESMVLLPPRRPRVLAVRLEDPSGDCRRCQAAVGMALEHAGVHTPETRPWLPHVTVGRSREPVRPGRVALPAVPPLRFTPPSVTLYRSRLAPGGAVYEPLVRVPV